MSDRSSVLASYEYCRNLARAAARNFYYGIRILPPEKRDALCALYAFMRGVDDIADEPGAIAEKQRGLAERRAEMDRALAGEAGDLPIWPAFRDTMERYQIPTRYLHDLISGAEMDLTVTEYETFDRLREYCYRVAGTVGLCCVHVFGFSDPRALELAERLGIAFQLTNILRDVPKDYEMGRVYLPQEDLNRFGCNSAEEFRRPNSSPRFLELAQFEADRAWQFYSDGWRLLNLVDEDSRAALWALARIYAGILARIEERGCDVLTQPPARLSAAEKIWILARARLGFQDLNYVLRMRERDRRRTGGTVRGRRAG
ncbi:MAG: phytoene/squalene synthase family protein [Candidatus Acidiferrales bacterium]